jgi:hypothetical protein
MAKLSTSEMRTLFRDSPVKVGEIYQHYKGGIYVVTCLTLDTDTSALRVSYARIGGPNFDSVAESGITFSRRIEEWTPDRFMFYVGSC